MLGTLQLGVLLSRLLIILMSKNDTRLRNSLVILRSNKSAMLVDDGDLGWSLPNLLLADMGAILPLPLFLVSG